MDFEEFVAYTLFVVFSAIFIVTIGSILFWFSSLIFPEYCAKVMNRQEIELKKVQTQLQAELFDKKMASIAKNFPDIKENPISITLFEKLMRE